MFHFVWIPNKNFLSAPGLSGNSAFTISNQILQSTVFPPLARMGSGLKATTHTESEQSLVFHSLCTADHVSAVALRQFIIAYIVPLHPLLFQSFQELGNLSRS